MKFKRAGLAAIFATLAAAGTAYAAFEQEGPLYDTENGPYAVYTADFNNDGRQDVVVENGDSTTFSFYMRQPGGGFALEGGAAVSVAPNAGPSYSVVGDFNGDSRPDIATASYNVGTVAVLLRNQANTGFTLEQTTGPGGQLGSIGAADFNKDGKLDIVVGQWSNLNTVTIMLRNANNNGFVAQQPLSTGGLSPRQIAVADFDGDKNEDVAVTNVDSDTVSVFRGSGTGGLSREGNPITVGDGPFGIVAADLDGDKVADLAVTNVNAGTVSVLLRSGTSFAVQPPITVGTTPTGITAADFDRDGRVDLAAASAGGTVDVLRNTASGFTRDSIPFTGGPYGIAAADLDGDGTADLAVSALTARKLAIFRNPVPVVQPPPPTSTPTPTVTPLPSPVAGKNVNAVPKEGTVKVKLPGTSRYIDLPIGRQLPVGTSFDTRKGTVEITDSEKGKADFFDGIFKLSQTKKPLLTTLTLTEQLSCPKPKKANSAAAKTKTRRLWGEGKGHFRTSGRLSSATVRGTKWLVTDTCTTTTTKVTEGSVTVRDFAKKKNFVVRKGKKYIARAKR